MAGCRVGEMVGYFVGRDGGGEGGRVGGVDADDRELRLFDVGIDKDAEVANL